MTPTIAYTNTLPITKKTNTMKLARMAGVVRRNKAEKNKPMVLYVKAKPKSSSKACSISIVATPPNT